AVLPAGSRRLRVLAAERPPRQKRPRPPENGQARCGVAGQGRRTGYVATNLVQPQPIRQLRARTRHRRTLIRQRSRGEQRMEKILEAAQIKLSAVVSDLFVVSGRSMIEALIAGQRNPWALARLARGTLRNKTRILEDALTGHFNDHHGFLCQMMLERIDGLTAQIG